MRTFVFALFVVIALGIATPAEAQLRNALPARTSPARIYGEGAGFLLNKLFSPEHFRMGHSYSMSVGGFGGSVSSLGVYTNSMMWQFSDKLAARVDVGLAHSPFGGGMFQQQQFGGGNFPGRVFLQNAEIAYRPNENMQLNISVRQSPYGSYMSPYGYYDPYGYRSSRFMEATFHAGPGGDLFWRRDRR